MFAVSPTANAAVCASFSGGGDGSSSAQAIHISTAADLTLLHTTSACWASGIYFQQQEDIDMGNIVWTSGIGRQEVRAFAGNYDGNGKSVSGLTVRSGDIYVGLFGYMSGSINSLGFTGDVEGTRAQVGGGPYIGGLVGAATGPVSYSSSTGDVTCNAGSGQYQCFAGGLLGLNTSSVSDSFSTGTVTASFARDASAGGLVGTMSGGSISNSYSTAVVQDAAGSTRMLLGGLVGNTSSGVSISQAYAIGPVRDVSGSSVAGGLLGRDGGVTFTNALWDSDKALTDATACIGNTGANPSGCTSTTDTALKDVSTFSGFSITSGYDAGSTWGICPAVNDGYPFLTAFYSTDPCSNPPSPSAGDYSRPTATFHFQLPDGTECAAISPQLVYAYTTYILPGESAPCRPPGSQLLGWSVSHQDWDFAPGATVYVVESQVFTAVLRQPTIAVTWDANVALGDTCLTDSANPDSNASSPERRNVTYLDRPDMPEYSSGFRPSLTEFTAPTVAACAPPDLELTGWAIATAEGSEEVLPGAPISAALALASPNGGISNFTFQAKWDRLKTHKTIVRAAFFQGGRDQLTENGQQHVRELLAALPDGATNVEIEILGVSNSLNSTRANDLLASRRAEILQRELELGGLQGNFLLSIDQQAITPATSSTGKVLTTVRITYQS